MDRVFTPEQLKNMDLATAEAELSNRVYAAALFIERLEGAGKVTGNGHHAAQQIVQAAVENLRSRWIKEPQPTSTGQG